MDAIHHQAVEFLVEVGVEVDHIQALGLLNEAGCRVNYKTGTIFFPESLIEHALELAPRQIRLGSRNPEKDLHLRAGGRMATRSTGGMAQIRDENQAHIRDITTEDTARFTRLIDGLDGIDIAAPIYARDVPDSIRDLKALQIMLQNTTKHINVQPAFPEQLPYLKEAGLILAGDQTQMRERPPFSLLAAPISPLKFPVISVETLLMGAEYGIPVEICPMPIMGATGPITIAGSLLLSIIEQLAAITLVQTIHPGSPVIWAPRFATMDMATGSTGVTLEGVLASAAASQMITGYYGMICDLYGPATNSILPDGKAVLEGSIPAFTTAYSAPPSILCGAGGLELGLTASLDQLVIDNEIIRLIRRIRTGFEITEAHLAAEVIERVGAGGNYLTDSHTMQFLRAERFPSDFLKPVMREDWEYSGRKDFQALVRNKVTRILRDHQPERLESDISEELEELIHRAGKMSNL
jgi:trimethylamine--corrinoid protein Co-methyltransferase